MPRRDERNTSRYVTDPDLTGVSLLDADFTTHSYPPHRHEAMVITTVQAGGAEITTRGASDEVSCAHLYVCNPTEPHSSRMGASKRWHFRSVYLTHGALRAAAAALGVRELPYFRETVLPDGALIASFTALQRTLANAGDPAQKREAFVVAIGRLFRGHGGAMQPSVCRDDVLARKIVERIEAEFAREISLADLAATAGLSVWQLIGLFKRTVGLTPHAYQTQARLNAACRALRRGTPIADAALKVGFYDQSALTRHFKARFGMTPLQFAAANRLRN